MFNVVAVSTLLFVIVFVSPDKPQGKRCAGHTGVT